MAKRKKRAARIPTGRSTRQVPRREEPPKPKPNRESLQGGTVLGDIGPGESGSRFAPVRKRARLAKLVVATSALVAFVVGLAATRASYAGHSKRPLHALAAPPGFVQIVRRNLLQAGIIAPAQAPPGASTSVS